jgi:ParE toxin of type II toxin-antitoxin system, parDE
MKVVLSARVERISPTSSNLAWNISDSWLPNGRSLESTHSSSNSFPPIPSLGKYLDEQGFHEVWIARTPFVVFYRVNAESDTITVLALFHHAQDRAAFDPDE